MTDRITFEDVSRFYGEILGINHVNLSIPPGVTSLVGPNGSGKTTLLKCMVRILKPQRVVEEEAELAREKKPALK